MKNYNTSVFVIITILIGGLCKGQNIYDIQVDEMFVNNDDLTFLNVGSNSIYICGSEINKLNDELFSFYFDCWEKRKAEVPEFSHQVFFNELLKFDSVQEFLAFAQTKRYEINSRSSNGVIRKSVLQHIFRDYYVLIEYYKSKNSQDYKISNVDLYSSYTLNVNDSNYVLVLINVKIEQVDGFIIPKGKNGVAFEKMEYAGDKIDDLRVLDRLKVTELFTVKKRDDGYYLSDRLFGRNMLSSTYDSIRLFPNFVVCKASNDLEIYDKFLNPIRIKNVRAVYGVGEVLQILKGDKIFFINKDRTISDTLTHQVYGVCGTVNRVKRVIKSKRNQILEITASGYMEYGNFDNTFIISDSSFTELLYLNGTKEHEYDGNSGLFSIYSNPFNLYYFESKDEVGLVEVKEFSGEYIFTKKLSLSDAKINLNGYFKPITFESNGLFGIYPIHKTGMYSKLDKYNYYFAKFEKDGKSGFVDLFGKEYF